jgi:hypothetical protein
MSASIEIWKLFPLFDFYEVSNLGHVRRKDTGRVRKPYLTERGYQALALTGGGCREQWHVHRIVCFTFHGHAPSIHHEVGHRNGNPSDNRSENLRWVTKKENAFDRIKHGRNCHGSLMLQFHLSTVTDDTVRNC